MKYFLSLLSYSYLVVFTEGQLLNLLCDFTTNKNVHNLLIFTCDEFPEDINLYKMLNKNNIFINTIDIEKSPIDEKVFNIFVGKMGIIVSSKCNNYEQILSIDITKNIFNENYFWLIIGDNVYSNYNLNVLNKSKIDINSEVNFVQENGEIFEIYNTGKLNGGVLKILPLGVWNVRLKYFIRDKRYKYIKRIDMSGVRLNSMIVITKKLQQKFYKNYLTERVDTHIDSMHRYHYVLLLHLRDIYNYR